MQNSLIAGILFSILYSLIIVLSQKYLRSDINPIHLNFFSYLFSLIIIFLFSFKKSIRKRLIIKSKRGFQFAILVALLGSVIADGLVLFGLKYSTAVNWALFSRLLLPTTFILSLRLRKEKANIFKWSSVLIALLGAYLIIYQSQNVVSINKGDIMLFLAVIAFSFSNIWSQYALEYIEQSQLLLIRIFTATLMWGIITLLFARSFDIKIWWYLILNGTTIVLGIGLVNYIISKSGATFFSLISSLVPVITILFSIYIFQEIPKLNQILGGVMVVLSIFVYQVNPSRVNNLSFGKPNPLKFL